MKPRRHQMAFDRDRARTDEAFGSSPGSIPDLGGTNSWDAVESVGTD